MGEVPLVMLPPYAIRMPYHFEAISERLDALLIGGTYQAERRKRRGDCSRWTTAVSSGGDRRPAKHRAPIVRYTIIAEER
jgi:hypothetical protein